jgi:MAP3K TRAFs-binding domain
MTPTLPAITALARAGALDQAWALFRAGGFDGANTDPAALAVKGRLFKDGALRARRNERTQLLWQSVGAYLAADALSPQPYLLINVATLTALAGDSARAAEIAGVVLERLDRPDIAETPYWLAATRAEALLLRGDMRAADKALAAAIKLDPDGWSDHASTLRQLRMILDAAGLNNDWLLPYRPPQSLHFAGHLGIDGDAADDLRSAVDAILTRDRIGFGYGSLAAGADIVIAESLIAHGAELHVILPTQVGAFAAQSVLAYGSGWLPRFDACLAAATSIRFASRIDGDYEPLATSLAADLAMGAAVLNAKMLESSAAQLLVIDDGGGDYGTGLSTARDGKAWALSGRSQSIITAPRSASVPASGRRDSVEGRADRRLAALFHISFDGVDQLDDAAFTRVLDDVIIPFRAACNEIERQPDLMLTSGNTCIAGFTDVRAAWDYVCALTSIKTALPLRIGGHYGLVHWLDDPPALLGAGLSQLADIAAASLPGTVTVSDAFASALAGHSNGDVRADIVGEAGDIRLFALHSAY